MRVEIFCLEYGCGFMLSLPNPGAWINMQTEGGPIGVRNQTQGMGRICLLYSAGDESGTGQL